ncbi:hypothetical protein ACFVYA_09595 [Amycolatopsis sp. NPDC058278]|uniref:hypothetical protein n=1 Tax=Amycolatopsis sp. NPDC058278 TaxID=3346417 RepID=UPI0036DE4474
MSKENVAASEEKEEKSGLRIAQVLAAALAAVTAALLGSTLGVAGTVAGAGVASVVSTVGSELYLRSLQRTREAALRARQLATSGIRRRGPAEGPPDVPITDQPTVQLKPPEEEPSRLSARLRKLRWPLIIGTSVAAFAVAILSIVGFESATGTQIGGGTGPSIGKIFTGGSGHEDKTPATTPAPSTDDTQVAPTDTSTTPTGTSTPPTTSSQTPTTTPSTTADQPSTSAPATSATPPTSKGAATTPTP